MLEVSELALPSPNCVLASAEEIDQVVSGIHGDFFAAGPTAHQMIAPAGSLAFYSLAKWTVKSPDLHFYIQQRGDFMQPPSLETLRTGDYDLVLSSGTGDQTRGNSYTVTDIHEFLPDPDFTQVSLSEAAAAKGLEQLQRFLDGTRIGKVTEVVTRSATLICNDMTQLYARETRTVENDAAETVWSLEINKLNSFSLETTVSTGAESTMHLNYRDNRDYQGPFGGVPRRTGCHSYV